MKDQRLRLVKAFLKAEYDKHLEAFKRMDIRKNRIVLLGDSLVAYAKDLIEDSVNLGIPGDTTQGVIDRLDLVYPFDPSRVVLWIGSNDLVLTDDDNETIAERILWIRDELEDNMAGRVIVATLAPVNEDRFEKHMFARDNRDIIAINAILRREVEDIVDAHRVLVENGKLRDDYTTDGLHLTDEGYAAFARALSLKL
ncbi:MAG: SGNH/GDSL hydrolase family protein [Acholeplasmataceae bacterium]